MHLTSLGFMSVALCLVSCAAAQTTPASAPAAPPPVVQHDGSEGFWLRTRLVEAFVALKPQFRVLSFRRIGQPSLLAGPGVYEQGVRLAFMEGEQIPASFKVGNVPAKVIERTASAATVKLDPADGLQYTVTMRLRDDRPSLEMKTALGNVGDTARRVGCWTVLAFARDGKIVVPFGDKPRMRRRLVLPWWTAWPQPGAHFGRDTLVVDAGAPLSGTAYKIGVVTAPGWIALARGGEAVLIHVPFDPAGDYPEDGANVTLFAAEDQTSNWCEIEQVGPMHTLHPGESTSMDQTLELLQDVTPKDPSPDAWGAAMQEAFNNATTRPYNP